MIDAPEDFAVDDAGDAWKYDVTNLATMTSLTPLL